MTTTNREGKMIYYTTIDMNKNDAPWITMVHGQTQNHKYFSSQVAEFQNRFRILLVDIRGHGQSTSLTGPFGIEEYSDDVHEVFNELGINETHYWGTHTGSAVGLVLALRYPERISSLILEGAFLPGISMPRTAALLERAKMLSKKEGVEIAVEDWFNNSDFFSYINANAIRCRAEEHRAMVSEFNGSPWLCSLIPQEVNPVVDKLHLIHQPVFVYNGEFDLEEFKMAALKLESDLSTVKRTHITEAGGFPGWESPKQVNSLVHSFLEHYFGHAHKVINGS
jgi:pimeloyl-ACP methyl ester carboxylesterase